MRISRFRLRAILGRTLRRTRKFAWRLMGFKVIAAGEKTSRRTIMICNGRRTRIIPRKHWEMNR